MNLIHNPPRYHRYKGGWANVTLCTYCGSVSLYEDNHPVNPCCNCGAKAHRPEYSARFVVENKAKWWQPAFLFETKCYWEFAPSSKPPAPKPE